MRRLFIILGLFAGTVLIAAIGLVLTIGPARIERAETACPKPPPRDDSRPFRPEQALADLCASAHMDPRSGVVFLLRRSVPLRTYAAVAVARDCAGKASALCSAKPGDAALEAAIDARLVALITPTIEDSASLTSAHFWIDEPFPWTGVIALRSDVSPSAALDFALPDGTDLTRDRVEAEYGAPQSQDNDAQGRHRLIYPGSGPGYTSSIVFIVDPRTNAVQHILVSVRL